MHDNATATHTRFNGGILAAAEKRTLIWLAHRMPRWVTSDHLSLLGLSAMLLTGLAFWAASWNSLALLLVVVALAVNWFGDSLDGTVARVRNQQRPRYGFYVDHVIDILGSVFLFGGLALSAYMSPLVALGLLVGYLMLSAETYLATHAHGVFRLSVFMVGPTELRILLALGTLSLFYKPWVEVAGGTYLLFDVGGVVAILGMAVAWVFSAVRNTRTLYIAEPLPRG